MFKDFQPAIIKLKDGKTSVHKQTNIFLKKSTLVYKKAPTGEIMEASMPVVAGLTVGEHNFINVKNQLAEVVATGERLAVADGDGCSTVRFPAELAKCELPIAVRITSQKSE